MQQIKNEKQTSDLCHDWNSAKKNQLSPEVKVHDETLRDGLQASGVKQPTIEERCSILTLMDRLGIDSACIGFPGASQRETDDITRVAHHAQQQGLSIALSCGGRMSIDDNRPIVEISQAAGVPLAANNFIGTSAIRHQVEGWSLADIKQKIVKAFGFLRENQLPIRFIAEDATRSDPAVLKQICRYALDCGAQSVVLCDTVGYADTTGVAQIVAYVRDVVLDGYDGIQLEWHGHHDRGLSLSNALVAIEHGANVIHATAMGVGERAGNTPMEQLLLNLDLMNRKINDPSVLVRYCRSVAQALRVDISPQQPIIGKNCFVTATGTHAAAMVKALDKGQREIANQLYTGIPTDKYGLEQQIEIGPLSGRANVRYLLRQMGVEQDDATVDRLIEFAKSVDQQLSQQEILSAIQPQRAKQRFSRN